MQIKYPEHRQQTWISCKDYQLAPPGHVNQLSLDYSFKGYQFLFN